MLARAILVSLCMSRARRKSSNYFRLSRAHAGDNHALLVIRSIDFTSLIHGCAPTKVLFSYLLIHHESNQMCHFANACLGMSHPPSSRRRRRRYHHRTAHIYAAKKSIVRNTLIEY